MQALSIGRKLSFQVTFSEQQHPYPATASPSRFHTHPGLLTPDEQTTTIVREAKQTYHMIYLSLSRKINQKRCHGSFYKRIHERRQTHSAQADTTLSATLDSK